MQDRWWTHKPLGASAPHQQEAPDTPANQQFHGHSPVSFQLSGPPRFLVSLMSL